MEPYCKVLPICYTPIQTSREFSVGQISCFKRNRFKGVISSRIGRVISRLWHAFYYPGSLGHCTTFLSTQETFHHWIVLFVY